MSPDKLAEMKRAAEACPNKDWQTWPDEQFWTDAVRVGWNDEGQFNEVCQFVVDDNDEANAAHIAASCPANVLALIADRDALQARAERAEAKIVELKDALQFVFECFDAAGAEGLHERLIESYDEGVRVALDFRDRSIWGLVERRLLAAGVRAAAILKGDEHE